MREIIIGRETEKQELSDTFNSKVAEFIVLYGRRRIGKSYLIEHFFTGKSCYFFHVTGVQDGLLNEQLREFAKVIGDTFYNGASLAIPSTWMIALEELTKAINNLPKTKKVVLFFDEFPWMCTHKSRIIQAVDYYWNRYWKNDKRIKFILCGSSASWIIKKIVNHKGGLHNRNTRTIILRPFNLHDTKKYLMSLRVKLNNEQIMQIYMFCGGVPYYLNNISKGKSSAKLIDKICFQQNGILYNEFEKLFDSLFDDSNVYKDIIRVISQVREGISRSDIESKVEGLANGGRLSERLQDLEDAAFIKSFIPLGHKRQGIYYRVIDEYCYFYLRWIEPAKKSLTTFEKDNQYWSSKVNSPEYSGWMGYAFESICYKHIGEIKAALKIDVGARTGVWRYVPRKNDNKQGAQIDLLFDRDDGAITLCEIKYTKNKYEINKSYEKNLAHKMDTYKEQTRTSKQIFIVFISANGLKKNKYSDELVNDVITLDELFKNI